MKWIRSFFLMLVLSVSLLTVVHAAEWTDVPEDAGYADAVYWAAEQDLIAGFEDGSFRPWSACTRGQAAAILWRAAGKPAPTLEVNPFRDVSPTMYNYSAILWAAEKGITVGRTADTFAPDEHCTTAQFLTFLWRAEGMPAASTASELAAANDGAYYTDALAWADTTGILDSSAEEFDANMPASRVDIATFLYLKSMPRMTGDTPLAGMGQLTISQQPQSMATTGGMVSFTVQASGGQAPYTYAWESRTGSGAWYRVYDTTSNTLTKFPAASMITSGLYFRCVVSDAAGNKVTSDTAKVLQPGESYSGSSGGSSTGNVASDSGPLTIKTQPQDAVLTKDGEEVTFKVEVTGGTAPYTYRWEDKNMYLDWAHVFDSASSNTLKQGVSVVGVQNEIRFRCVITDATGAKVVSREAAVSYGGNLPAFGVLTIEEMPSNISCRAGDTVSVSIDTVGGTDPINYKWEYRTKSGGWSKFAEGTMRYVAEFQTTAALLKDDLQIRCTVSDANGSTLRSDIARIKEVGSSVDGTLKVTEQPQDVAGSNYSVGDPVRFSVKVSGGAAPYSYHWQAYSAAEGEDDYIGFYDIGDVPGGWTTGHRTSELTVPFSEELLTDDFQFCCLITDANGKAVVTKAAGFTDAYTGPRVFEDPGLTIYNPTTLGDHVDETTYVEFTVRVEGGVEPYTYQWEYRPQSKTGEDPKTIAPIVFSSADSAWASGFNTDTLKVLVYSPLEYSFEHTRYYMSPSYRCKITAADGQFIYSNWGSSTVYDHKG